MEFRITKEQRDLQERCRALSADFAGGTLSEEAKAGFLATIPLGRFSTPLDVANACLYLASDEASLISGICIEVDGARSV